MSWQPFMKRVYALRKLQVIVENSDCFIMLVSSVVIVHGDNIAIGFSTVI